VDAVGIGSDFDGVGCTPAGLDDVSQFPNLTRALLERGYSEADIRKIYGGNTLRLLRAVEKAAGVH
jgi:membrane dipeptidase